MLADEGLFLLIVNQIYSALVVPPFERAAAAVMQNGCLRCEEDAVTLLPNAIAPVGLFMEEVERLVKGSHLIHDGLADKPASANQPVHFPHAAMVPVDEGEPARDLAPPNGRVEEVLQE